MNWADYRSNHLATYGPSTRAQLSKDYEAYKKKSSSSLSSSRVRSPVKSMNRSPQRKSPSIKRTTKYASPIKTNSKSLKTSVKSPVKSNKKVNLKDIEKMAQGKKFLIVVLHGDWCGACRALKEELGPKFKDTNSIKFIEDANIEFGLTEYYPRILYFENGEQMKDLVASDVITYLK
jgi:thiol-disulfide isomerase/thioredoxin